ncbi:Beta-N-acetylhexosaminidase precursor [Streptococcus mitis]|uniref:alpha-L-fucosidase n=1 Tax=Streptococcus mitis TaxID=28037 RepID=A0A3R9IVB3_STRMT|nr:alpha-L-fucosidase [Streptococcus mitis]RSI60594.1 Beta-N-acetylhexosaminidase precursor [Streptococcus mitis]
MNRYLFEKEQTFSIRKLTVGVASVMVGLAFFASGTALADEAKIETTSSQPNVEKLAEVEKTKPETKNESPVISTPQESEQAEKAEKTVKPVEEKTVAETKTTDLLPEEIHDQAYPDAPVKNIDTSAIVDKKDSPKVETESILKNKEELPKEAENGNRAIINGGLDLKHVPYEGQPATAASMIYTIYNGGSQRYIVSGSGIFVAPNVILTVAHNFLESNRDTKEGHIRGGDSAKFYYNLGSNSAVRNSQPVTGNTTLFKEEDIHFWNKKEFGKGYQNDLAAVVAPVPLQIASPNKAATFVPLAENKTYQPGDPVSTIGYPTDSSSPELKKPIVAGQLYKADGVVKSVDNYDDKGSKGITYHMTSVSGLSGAGIINGDGKVVGVHQHGTIENGIPDKDRFGGGIVLSPEQVKWVKDIIAKYGVKGWYQGDNGKRYYFTPEGEMFRNKTAVIGENQYSFDENGVATLIKGIDYGRVVVQHVDETGNPIKTDDTFVEKTEVGTAFDYNFKKEIAKTDFYTKNQEKYQIVSIDGVEINKQLKDEWTYNVVSKTAPGTRVIKVVYKVNKGSFAIHYRLKGSEQELADVVTDNNDGKEYDVSFVNTFEAKEIAGYRAITPRLEASIQHKGVNDVVFEYEKISDSSNPTSTVLPAAHPEDKETEIGNHGPLPSKAQLDYHKEELAAFIHYGMNTYTNSEWGHGNEDPGYFNPTNLDTDQWIRTLKETGFKRTIMVVKHHDGFVIYPSKYTNHTVAASPWKDGKGDLLEEVSKSATKYDMNMGVYLSPWDVNSPKYKVDTEKEYNEYYLNQLKEILGNPKYGNKGKFIEVWMDGARGSGAQKVTYTFDEWFKYIKEAEGDIAIFSAQPTSIRWIGNERGIAGDPVWHKVKKANITENVKNEYLNHGDPDGDMYSVGEADVSIRSGWFYHDNQQPKSLKELMDIYFKSVGRGTPLLLNIPPNKEGKFADADVARLKEFKATLDQMYATDFAKGATVTASSTRQNHLYKESHLTDGKDDTSWALSNDATTGSFTVDLGQKRRFDVVELKEDIAKGQRISGFKIEVEINGRWVTYGEGSTVGYRRLIQGKPVEAQKIRVTITGAQATPILTNFSVYKTPSSIEKTDGYPLGLEYHSNTTADTAGTTWYNESEGVRGTSMWTNQKDAKVSYTFTGTKAYVVSTVDPGHGEMSVYVDGQKVADVQTKNTSRKRSQKVYETDDLAPGQHTITLVNKTGEPIATEGIYTLNNDSKGMFELESTNYEVEKGKPVTVKIKRVGGSKGTATVRFITEPGTGVHGKVYQDTTQDVTFEDGETEKTVTIPTIDFTEQADSIFDFKAKLTSVTDGALLGFATDATIQVMKAELLIKDQTSYDDQASQLDYSPGWHHETDSADKYQKTESWASFGRLTDEQKKKTTVTAYFYGTGLDIKGYVDPNHGIYKVFLDGKEVPYQDGMGNASTIEGKKYFSGHATQRQGNQTLVSLKGLDENLHAVTLQLDSDRNDLSRNIGIQVDQFITRGEGSELYSKTQILQSLSKWKDDLSNFDPSGLKNTATARQAFKSNLDKLTAQLSSDTVNVQDVMSTVTALQDILSKDENYQKPGDETSPEQPVEPKQPEQPEINYDKAMASLTEAIEKKVAELGANNDAKKKLVEITDKAIAAIQEAKTQEDVNKALNNALEQIKQLQPSQPEQPVEPKQPEQPEQPEINYDKAMASLTEAIEKKVAELGANNDAKKKLVEITDKAIAAIQEAKTQEDVNKALNNALEQIKQLQPSQPEQPVEPKQPEQPKINYDKAMASLTEAIEKKVAELGTNNDAKKKLVEITDKAIAAIQEAKTQEDVNKALNNALEQIKQLQPSQPEQPVEPKQPEKPITSSSPEEGVKELVFQLPSLDIVKKVLPFKTIRRENPQLDKGKEQVLAEGKDGAIIEYVEVDGSNRKVVQTESTPALDRVIEVGTKQSSVGTDTPPVVTLPEYLLPKEPEKPITSSSPEEGVKDLVFKLPSLDIVKKAVPFKTIRHENPNLDKGKEKVLAEGKDGLLIEYVEVDGSNRKVVQTKSTPALDRIIEVGTKQSSVGTEAPPVVTLPEYVLPRETEKPAPAVVTEDSPRKDEKAPVATTVRQDKEKQLPETGEQEANAFLFLAAITSVLSLLIFQKNFKD